MRDGERCPRCRRCVATELERDRANALLREARLIVGFFANDNPTFVYTENGVPVEQDPGGAHDLLARIDAHLGIVPFMFSPSAAADPEKETETERDHK